MAYHVGMKSLGPCCADTQDKDDWGLRINGTTGNWLTQVDLENGR